MICVIGGANIDIQGFSFNKIISNDSNPGKIEKGFGGVARNIAENLALLNAKTKFIAPIGDDDFSNSLIKYMEEKNIDMNDCLKLKNQNLSTYLSILNDENEMVLAISAMDILNFLDIEYIKKIEENIKKADVVVVDTNLREDVLEYISKLNNKIIIDLVSTTKALKVKNFLSNFHSIKANKIETEILTGIKINDNQSIKLASEILINKGIKNVFITLGKEGIFYANKEKSNFIKNPDIDVIDITGAGDAFSAGIAYSLLKDFDIDKSAKYALSMSLLNVSNIGTCYQKLNENKLNETVKIYFKEEL